jgi:phytoene dehydrogenase-like protein
VLVRLKAKVVSDDLPTLDQSSVDVIVIGSGLAGLCCAALLSYCGVKTLVLESHDVYGGAAHSWERRGFHFESGPSLYSGLSDTDGSPNPLKNIFQILDEDCEWITYDRWGTVLPNGDKFAAQIGPTEEFLDALRKFGNGEEAVNEFQALVKRMTPLSDAARALPSLALREDLGAVVTLSRYPRAFFDALKYGPALNEPFGNILEEMQLQNKFVRNWLDMLCFLLQGLPAAGTMNAVMGYMLADWYRPGVTLDYPKGGSGAICDTLVRAIRRYGGNVCLNAHVEEIIVENNRAGGVRVKAKTCNNNGEVTTTIRAQQAVVSNADPYVTKRLLGNATLSDAMQTYMDQWTETDPAKGGIPDLKSFIHLHAGIDAAGLPISAGADFPAQWAVITDWDMEDGVEAPRNIVLCSMPSLIDPSLAPPGKHVIHAYVPATEPYEWWANMDRKSEAYRQKKDEAADFLWRAVEHYVPNARDRAVPGTVQIGTPLTHERFLRRTRGTYGYVYILCLDLLLLS